MPFVFDDEQKSTSSGFVFEDEKRPENTPGILNTIKNVGTGISDTWQALKSGVGSTISMTGTVADDPAAFLKTSAVAIGDTVLTGPTRFASFLKEKAFGDGSLPLGMDRGAETLHEMFQPAYDQYGSELAQARKAADARGDVSSVLRGVGAVAQEDAQASLSPQAKARDAEYAKTEGFGALGYLATHPGKFADMVVENLPSQVMMLGTGYGAGAVARSVAGKAAVEAGNVAFKEALLTPGIQAAQIEDGVLKASEVAATKAMATAQPYLTALNIGNESFTTVAQTADAIHSSVNKAKPEDLAKLPMYQEYLAQSGGNVEDAKRLLAARLTVEWAPVAGMGTAFGSVVTGGAKAEAEALAGQVTGFKQAAKGVGKEMLEEAIQNPLEDLAQHTAQIQVDPTDTYDPIKSSIEGAAVSMGHSGALQFSKPTYDAIKGVYDAKKNPPTNQGGANEEVNLPPSGGNDAAAGLPTTPETSAAEKALLTPVSLTSLDRVNEIDKAYADYRSRLAELNDPANGYGPMFDQERQDIEAQQKALSTERNDLAKDWPKSVPGAQTNFSTEAGARVDATYSLMDAGDLITSHDENLRKNPAYPSELQPRERDRAASEMQVSSIVQKLDPQRLGLSADAANGAPIVGADGLVESGNARTIALKRVYQANGQKAADYKDFLRANAAQFGISPESIDAMANPVLVRVRTTPVNRAEFARQANASTVAAMAPSEQAKSDANRIDSMDDLTPDDNGDFSNAASRPFIKRFMARLPMTEQSGMVDATGALSTTGYARVRNAVLAKAYGDSPVLARMTESMDDNLRNVSRALILAAPKVAQMRSAVSDGTRFDADITPDLMMAVEELSKVKGEGGSVSDALAQTDLMGEQRTPEARQLLSFLNDNMRRPRRIADFIGAYMDALDAAGDPNQGSLLGEVTAPAKGDLLTAAQKATQNEVQDNGSKGPVPDAKDSGEAGLKPQNAPGSGQGTQTNGVGNGSGVNANAAGQPDKGWIAFPSNTGTLGIPRARMPQVKGVHRGAMINFLQGQGIENSAKEIAPADLKPTQAEFAPAKVEKHIASPNGSGERSVLVSSDNYILDGHHQWLAHLADNRPVKVIKFDAPISTLLAKVHEFPSSFTEAGASSARADNVVDFKAALADLAQIASKHTRIAFVPEDTPNLMPTLVKLMTAGIKEVGYELRDLIKYVKEALKSDARFKTFWNRISNDTYKKAAQQAMDQTPDSGDLFAQLSSPNQGGLFDGMSHAAPQKSQTTPAKLLLGDNAPDKSKPVVLVYGGSFNPTHAMHVEIAIQARDLLTKAGYTVKTILVSPSPQSLMVAKSGAEATKLVDRTAMARKAFAGVEGVTVTDAPSRAAAEMTGKLKRTQQADWAKSEYPDATIISLTGEDSAPGHPPGFPSVYSGDKGSSHEGYHYLAMPRDESESGVSSSKVRKLVAAGESVPSSMADPKVVQHWKAVKRMGNEIALDGELYDIHAPNYGFKEPPQTLADNDPLLQETDKKAGDSAVTHKGETTTRAEMHQDIIDYHFEGKSPAPDGRKPIAYVMGGGGASGKGRVKAWLHNMGIVPSVNVVNLDPDEIKMLIPEYLAIVAAGDWRAADTVHEESSALGKQVKARAIAGRHDLMLDVTLGIQNKAEKYLQELKDAGYEVRLFGVTVEPEVAVARAMIRFEGEGRFVPIDQLLNAHRGFNSGFASYADLVDQAVLYENTDGRTILAEKINGALVTEKGYNVVDDRSKINENANTLGEIGGSEQGTGRPSSQRREGDSNSEGAGLRGSVGRENLKRQGGSGNESDLGQDQSPQRSQKGGVNVTPSNGTTGDQTQGSATAQGTDSERGADGLRTGFDGTNPGKRGNRSAPDSGTPRLQQDVENRPNESGGHDEHGSVNGTGDRAGANAGVPAGRDIPPKSGLNYAFGDTDLTYEGSWVQKATQNTEAVELVKKLQTENRQATREEQAKLAQFIGWGASDLANNLFGAPDVSGMTKMDRVALAMENYAKALKLLEDKPYLTNSNYQDYRAAFAVLQYKNKNANWYTSGNITKAMLDAAKPDATAHKYLALRDRLKAVMTDAEWADASRSTQNAHYTSKPIVKSMWRAMERMGFKGGHMLEPGAGIGVFPGLMPAGMAANTSYTGIEFDAITGAILKQLLPDERILTQSYFESKLPKNFYDVAAGNPPFGNVPVLSDPEYKKYGFAIHDYFFAKTIDRIKPGGLVMFVTSRYTMDKLKDTARAYLAERADLVGAIRLPQTAFKQNAGTDVVTDVLFLRKKVPGESFEQAQAWGKSAPMKVGAKAFPINEYFHAHPDMVLGTPSDTGQMANSPEPQYTVLASAGDIETLFDKAVDSLPADIYQAQRGSAAEAAKVREIDFNPKAKKEGNYYLSDAGVLMQREGGFGQRVELKSPKDVELVKDFVPLRDALKQAHYDQLNNGDWQASLSKLQAAYAKFVKKNGQISQYTERVSKVKSLDEDTGETFTDEVSTKVFTLDKKLRDDPDWTLVQALENVNEDTGAITPSDFLSKRVLEQATVRNVSTPIDALLTTLNDIGHVDMDLIGQRVGLSRDDTIEALGTAVYLDPEGDWVTADDYLSGNVKNKLALAREAAKADRRYERNIDALLAVQPAPLAPSQIDPNIGMNWIPSDVYEDFIRDITDHKVDARISWQSATKSWHVSAIQGERTMAATSDWGTGSRNVVELMEHALKGSPIRVTRSEGKGADKKTVFDEAATQAALQKLDDLKNRFRSWVFAEPVRADKLVTIYNDNFNTTVPRSFDGSHLTLPGTSSSFNIFDHVKRGAWRIMQRGNTYLAHAVGSGKTYQMVISAMEQKRLGLIKKPMMVVPNHMLKQFASEWQQLYPAARLMVADETNFHTDNRRRFVSRVAMSDLDGVIITHSAFKILDLDPAFKAKMIEQELVFLRAALIEAGGTPDQKGKSRDPKIKRIENQVQKREEQLAATMSSEGKDKNARFDELGVDFLYVDEAHEFRKLDFATTRQVKGIDPMGSARAFDLYMKSRYLEEKTPGRSMVLASGTPITNTLAEMYTVQKLMDRQSMVDKNVDDFDSWAAMFGRTKTGLEAGASGVYDMVERFSDFSNVPELTQMFREFADVLTSDNLGKLLGDKRPKVANGTRTNVVTPKTDQYTAFQQQDLVPRFEASKAWKPSRNEMNNPDPIIAIMADARLAAIDMRFMEPTLPNDPDSKLNRLVDDVIAKFKETADIEYVGKDGKAEPNKGAAMMVFADQGFGAGVAANRGFSARAWMEKRLRDAGIPMNQVAFMSDYKKSDAKRKLFGDVNAGRVRMLVGSSVNMGTGVNAQQRLKAMFHMDAPWFPAALEQREGRIIRTGNKNKVVEIYAYAAKGSYDQNLWAGLARKQLFIDKALSGDPNVRNIEDLGAASLMDQMSATIAEDPRVLQLAGLNADIAKYQRLYQAHEDARKKFQHQNQMAQATVSFAETKLPQAEADAAKSKDLSGDKFTAKVLGQNFDERVKWAEALIAQFKQRADRVDPQNLTVGEISGFPIVYNAETVASIFRPSLRLETPAMVELVTDAGTSPMGVAMRAQNAVVDVARFPGKMRERIAQAKDEIDALQNRLQAPFQFAQPLADAIQERDALLADLARPAPNEDVETTDPFGSFSDDDMAAGAGMGMIPEMVLSRGSGGSMDVAPLQALANKIKKRMPNMPKVHVLASPADAPKALRDYIEKQGAMADAEGALHNGELYLFASGMPDVLRAEHVLAEHEAAHFGLRALLGDSLPVVMRSIFNNNASVRQAVSELQKRGKLSATEATEEAIVDIPSSQLVKLNGWRKVVQKARDWLADHGFENMADKLSGWLDGKLSDQQRADMFVANLVRSARIYMAGKNSPVRGVPVGTMLSGTLAEDVAKQERWLATEARARGYADIDQLAEKNYPLFEKLAELWRKKNPADNGVLLSRDRNGSGVLSKDGAFKAWPKDKNWNRAEYNDVVSLLPQEYRNDPHRREPMSAKDWDALDTTAVPEIEALNAKVGAGTFRIDGLGNILADARKNSAAAFINEAIRIADQHGLGIFITGVPIAGIQRLRDAGFDTEMGLVPIIQREARFATPMKPFPSERHVNNNWMQPPRPNPDNNYQANYGTIMSRKPRGFASSMLSRVPLQGTAAERADNGVLLSRVSSAFKKWFGNSKVVNPDGTPMIVYHGTRSNFDVVYTKNSSRLPGFWLTTDPQLASTYAAEGIVNASRYGEGANVMPLYARIEKPYLFNPKKESFNSAWDKYIDGDYDGFIEHGNDTKGVTTLVVKSGEQVKSAIGNNGQFDGTNPDIRMSRAPLKGAAAERADNGVLLSRGSADDTTPGARVARQIFEVIEKDDDFADYALRVIPGEFKGEINVGDILPSSKRWADGNETKEALEGTSAVRIRNQDEKSILDALKNLGALGKNGPNGFYFGDRIALVKGESIGSGEDVGESIIKNAEIVGIWKKPSQGLSEIQPNNPTAPDSGGAISRKTDQTDTAAFKAWFGDSKVVDAQGKPLVVYHGTGTKDITVFNRERNWFTSDQSEADDYAKDAAYHRYSERGIATVMPIYLSIKNPLIVDASGSREQWHKALMSWAIKSPQDWELKKQGYDGVVFLHDGKIRAYPFNPTQIKSATGNNGQFSPTNPDIRMSRAPLKGTAAERADQIIKTNAATAKPIDAMARKLTQISGVERLTKAMYRKAGYLLNRYTPETVKAGMVSDYGVPEAVIDQRAMMQGRQRVQLRQAGTLIDKLSTLTRAESQVAYEWMNETDPHTIYTMMHNLPEDSVKVLQEVQAMIDNLSKEAVRMGQLSPDAYERNKFAYLRRSYAKYTLAQTDAEKKGRARVISILGEQYKGRGLTESAAMDQIKNAAPEWWARKLVDGKADKGLKGEKFIRLERHAPSGERTAALPGMDGKQQGKLKEVHYFPAGLALPAKYAEWTQAGTFEARDTKGANLILWRDFTKDERENMGEIDEARFAIAKTLHAMIHDVEVGRYLEWLAHKYAKKEGETIPGTVVDASERYADTFKPGEWVKVPDSKIQGTAVLKYGTLAGRYLPGPIWNDLRQTVNGQFKPFGDTYAKILSLWKTSKTALSPAVHMNNVMSNFVMADWHDVTAGHTAKALRIILGAHGLDGQGALGAAGNKIAQTMGTTDRAAAKEVMNRYLDSGGNIGSWATNEVATKQIEPLLAAMEAELAATNGNSVQAQVGVMSALQHLLHARFPDAFASFKGSKPGKIVGTEAKTIIDLYQNEDEVFRLASWLKSKEEGKTDMEAGKIARRSFMDYNINAPWISALRNSALPFVSYTYRAVPMMLETASNKPHKLLKLMAFAGALNALGVLLAGGDDDKDRRLLPEEKAGRIWGMVPKLIRMPWNDKNASPVYLDIRRFIPIGDVLDVGQNHSAIPLLPMMTPGGPLVMLGEVVLNKTGFTGKPITLETDTPAQQAVKVMDYLYKSFMPNVIGLPGTYATTGVYNAIKGKTDAFGREQSTAQAMASAFGVKLASYPADVMRRNEYGKAQAQMMEIDKNISQLKRQYQTHTIDSNEFQDSVRTEQEKKRKIQLDLSNRIGG